MSHIFYKDFFFIFLHLKLGSRLRHYFLIYWFSKLFFFFNDNSQMFTVPNLNVIKMCTEKWFQTEFVLGIPNESPSIDTGFSFVCICNKQNLKTVELKEFRSMWNLLEDPLKDVFLLIWTNRHFLQILCISIICNYEFIF